MASYLTVVRMATTLPATMPTFKIKRGEGNKEKGSFPLDFVILFEEERSPWPTGHAQCLPSWSTICEKGSDCKLRKPMHIASVLGFNGPMHTRYLHIIIIEGMIGNSLSLGKAL